MSKLDDFWAKRGDRYKPLTAAERAEYDRLVAEEQNAVAPTPTPAAATANATESVEEADSGEPGAFTKYAGIPFRGGAVSGVLTRNFLKALTGMKNSDQDLLVMDPNQMYPVGASSSEDTPERQTAKEVQRVANEILNEGRPGMGQQLRDAILGRDKTSPSSEFMRQAAAEKKAYEILGLPVPKGVEQQANPGLGMRAMNLGLDVALDPMTYIGMKPAVQAGRYVAGKTAASKLPAVAKLGSMAPATAENAMVSGILGTNPVFGAPGLGITRYLAGKGLTKYAPEFAESNPTLMRIIGGPKYGTPAAGTAAKLLAEGVEEAPVTPKAPTAPKTTVESPVNIRTKTPSADLGNAEPYRSPLTSSSAMAAPDELKNAIDEFDAVPNSSTVTVYHGTTRQNAEKLLQTNKLEAGAGKARGDDVSKAAKSTDLYVAATPEDARMYAGKDGVVVKLEVPKSSLAASPEIGEGRSVGYALYNPSAGAVLASGTPVSNASLVASSATRAGAPQFKTATQLLDLIEPEQQVLSTTRKFPRKGQFGYDPTATQTPFANVPQRAVPDEAVDPEQLRLFNPDEQLRLFGQSPLEDPAKLPQVQALLQRMNPRYTGGRLGPVTANPPAPLLQFMLRQEEFDKGVGDLVGQLRQGSATGRLRGKFASEQSRELADQIANALEDPALSPAMKRVLRQQWIEAAVKAGQLQPSVGQGLYNMSDKYIK